jgi:hypothetical protein
LPQTRINFARGRSSAAVKGNLGAKGSRMYVLRAGAGQTLYARFRFRPKKARSDIRMPTFFCTRLPMRFWGRSRSATSVRIFQIKTRNGKTPTVKFFF